MAPTPRITARAIVEMFPDIGASASTTLDSAVVRPIVLVGGSGISSTWNAVRSETRKLLPNETGVTFEMPGDAVLVALMADGPFVFRAAPGDTELILTDILLGGGDAPMKTGDLAFEVDGNGDTSVNLSVVLVSKV